MYAKLTMPSIGLFLLGLIAPLGLACADSELKGSKPNVLIIMADDTTWRDYGFMGSKNSHTPTLDRLAGEGLVMDRFYTAASMCAPCRSHLYTGIYPVKSGAHPNHCTTRPNTKSMVHYLKDQGYRVGLAGKKHITPESVYPFENIPGVFGDCTSSKNPRTNLSHSVKFWTRDRKQPFCQVMAFVYGHAPWTAGNATNFDPKALVLPGNVYDEPQFRRIMCSYLAEIEQLDKDIAMVMEELKKNNLYDNTVIIFLSEQGMSFPWAKKSCYEDGLKAAGFVWWPEKIKPRRTNAIIEYVDVLPTLIELAGGTPAKALEGRSFVQVLAGETDTHKTEAYGIQTTLCSGGKPYPIRTVRDEQYRLVVNYYHKDGFSEKGLLAEWAKYQDKDPKAKELLERLTKRPQVELYDHSNDPDEIRNLASNPEYRAVREKLMGKLNAWLEQQGESDPLKTELNAMSRCASKTRVAEAKEILKNGNYTTATE